MKKLKVEFEREYDRRIDEEGDERKKYEKAVCKKVEIFIRKLDKRREKRRMPYSVATNGIYDLWKFFMSYNHLIQSMEFLDEPRYAVRKGQQWWKVIKIEEI